MNSTFFLEDTKIEKKENSFNLVMQECNNLSIAIAQNEIAWNNIVIQSIKEDYNILMEEESENTSSDNNSNIEKGQGSGAKAPDSDKVIEVRKTFLEKVLDFLRKMRQKILNIVNNIINRLTNISGMQKRFVAMHKNTILKGANLGFAKANIYEWTGGLGDATALSSIPIPNPNPETIANIQESVNKKIDTIIKPNAQKKEITINGNLANKSIKNVAICDKAILNIKKISATNQQQLKQAERLAKVDSTRMKDGEEFEKVKAQIKGQKDVVSACDEINNKIISTLTKLMSDSHTINKACIKAANTKAKNLDKKQKNNNQENEEKKD